MKAIISQISKLVVAGLQLQHLFTITVMVTADKFFVSFIFLLNMDVLTRAGSTGLNIRRCGS